MFLDKCFPLYALGIFLPLSTVNGTWCISIHGEKNLDFGEVLFMVLRRSRLGLAIVLLAGIREKLKYSDILDGFEGLGINYNCWFDDLGFVIWRIYFK